MSRTARNRRDAWADSIVNYLNKLGIGVESIHHAQTGTIYIETCGKKIRVSDHGDAYGTSDYTCDGLEGDLKGCKAWILQELGQKIDREEVQYERNLARARKALDKARAHAMDNIYMPLLREGKEQEASVKCAEYLAPFQEAFNTAFSA